MANQENLEIYLERNGKNYINVHFIEGVDEYGVPLKTSGSIIHLNELGQGRVIRLLQIGAGFDRAWNARQRFLDQQKRDQLSG